MPTINDAHTIIFQDSKGSDILGDEFGLLRSSMDRNAMLLDQYIRDQKRREDDSLVRQTMPRDQRSRPDEMRQMAGMMSRGVQHVHLENAMSDIVYPLYERMLIIADESSTRQERYDREHFFYYSKMVEALDGINENNEDVTRGLVLTYQYMRNHPIMATGKAFISLIKGAAGVVKTAGNIFFGQKDQRNIEQKQLDVQKRTLHFIRTGEATGRSRSMLTTLKEEGIAGTIAGTFAKQLAQDREKKKAAGEDVGSGFLGLGSRADASQSEFITLLGRSGAGAGGSGEYYPKMIEQLDKANKKLFSIVYFMTQQHPELLENFKLQEQSLLEMGKKADSDGVWRVKSIGKFNEIESFLGKLTHINEDQLDQQDKTAKYTKKNWWANFKHHKLAVWMAIKGGVASLLTSPIVIAGIIGGIGYALWKRFKDDNPIAKGVGAITDGMSTGEKALTGVAGVTGAIVAAKAVLGSASVMGMILAGTTGWLAGSAIGDVIAEWIDIGINKASGGEYRSLGDAFYSFLHPNEKEGDNRHLSEIPYNEFSGFLNLHRMYKPYVDGIVQLGRITTAIDDGLRSFVDNNDNFVSKVLGYYVSYRNVVKRLLGQSSEVSTETEKALEEHVDNQSGFVSNIMSTLVGWKDSFIGLFKREKIEVTNEFDSITGASEQVTRSWNDKFQQFRATASTGWKARSEALDQWGTDWISNFDQNKETINKHIKRATRILQSAIPFFRQNKTETSSISDEINNEMEDSMGRLETAFSSVTGFFGGIRDRIRGFIKGDEVDAVVPTMTDEDLDSVISRMSQVPISPITSIGNQSRQQMPISSIASEESRSFAPVERSSVFKNPDAAQGADSPFDPDRFKDPEVSRLLKSIDGHLNNMRRERLDIIPFGNEPDALMNLNLMGE